MMDPQLRKALSMIDELPSIPVIANRVMASVSDPSTSSDDLRAILEQELA